MCGAGTPPAAGHLLPTCRPEGALLQLRTSPTRPLQGKSLLFEELNHTFSNEIETPSKLMFLGCSPSTPGYHTEFPYRY